MNRSQISEYKGGGHLPKGPKCTKAEANIMGRQNDGQTYNQLGDYKRGLKGKVGKYYMNFFGASSGGTNGELMMGSQLLGEGRRLG